MFRFDSSAKTFFGLNPIKLKQAKSKAAAIFLKFFKIYLLIFLLYIIYETIQKNNRGFAVVFG